jgi:putative tryptophan/tyrosine transport system substrate-binding protein
MRRRDFLKLLGSAGIAAPACASAQTPSRTYRVGLLSAGGPIGDVSPFGAPLIRGLAKYGYELGRNLAFERRAAEGRLDRLPRLVDELVASKVDVIHTNGYPPALAAKQGATIPVVVIAAGDPVATGLIESLARPGGNLTGVSDVAVELSAKRMGTSKGNRTRAASSGNAVERR